MTKIVTIWWGNGQSVLLDAMYRYFPKKIEISSIVSMSDDGRTTGKLMREFEEQLGLHLPPPWDLRRCLFMMSDSENRDDFKQYLETVIEKNENISNLTIREYFSLVWASEKFLSNIAKIHPNFLDFQLPLQSSIKGHKMGNLLMANLYYNLDTDYNNMLEFMHKLLKVRAQILPVTTQKAFIRAILWNGEIVETQDRISDFAAYTSGIADLELMENSKDAEHHKDVQHVIKKADFIVISPGDLFTSIISNFVIGWVKEAIQKSDAKIIYIANNTNKWGNTSGETRGLTLIDFINKIERFLGRRIDIFLCNNGKILLSQEDKVKFQSDISVKGGDFLYLSNGEKSELQRRKIQFIEADLLDRESFYKHDKNKLARKLLEICDIKN